MEVTATPSYLLSFLLLTGRTILRAPFLAPSIDMPEDVLLWTVCLRLLMCHGPEDQVAFNLHLLEAGDEADAQPRADGACLLMTVVSKT